MVYLLTGLLVALLFLDYKKFFVIYMSISVWLSMMPIFGQDVLDIVSMAALPMSVFFVRFPYKSIKQFPLKYAFTLLALSYILTNYFAAVRHTPQMIISMVITIWNVFMFWLIIESNPKRYLRIFIKSTIIFGSIIGIYAFIETMIGYNPIVNFFNSRGIYDDARIITEIRFGLKRCQSIFGMHTTAGGTSMLICLFLGYLYKIKLLKMTPMLMITIVCLSLACFFNGSRSVIIGFTFGCLMFVSNLKLDKLIPLVIFVSVTLVLFDTYFEMIFGSISNTNTVRGSDTQMRSRQFEICLLNFSKSPIFGNGISYIWEHVAKNTRDIFGAESVWFPVMVNQGLLGIVSYVVYYISLIYMAIKNNCFPIVYFVIGIIIMFTLSSMPNIIFTYPFFYIYALIKRQQMVSGVNVR